MLISAKLAPVFDYSVLERFWREADDLGFHAIWDYDHFYGLGANLSDFDSPTLEGWTTLAAMAAITARSRVGCMVTGVTYRHPAVLAKMAVTVDQISGGRLEFGIGAAWHEPEHRGLGLHFPPPGERVAMLDEALDIITAIWSGERPTIKGRYFSVEEALCSPLPVQRPHPPIVVGGTKPKMLRVIAKHADEWNTPAVGPEMFAQLSAAIDGHCAEYDRHPSQIRRSVQLFLHPSNPDQVEEELAKLPDYEQAGCEHVVLSFYQPPSHEMLVRCAPK